MTELRIVFQGSSLEHTQVFVEGERVCHVQKVVLTPSSVQIFFPPPSLNPSRRFQIERSMGIVRDIPGVVIGHTVTDDARTLGKFPKRGRAMSKKVSV